MTHQLEKRQAGVEVIPEMIEAMHRERRADANIAGAVPEEVIEAVACDLSLGLDCNVSLMACREAVGVLFSELRKHSWTISPS